MKKMKKYIILTAIMWSAGLLFAQQVNNSYFIKNDPLRHNFNAAFQPDANVYFSAPAIGQMQFNLNLPVSLSNLIQKKDGQERWFFDPAWDGRQDFLKALGKNPSLGFGMEMNLLSLGLRVKKSYLTLSLNEKVNTDIFLPRGVFDMLFDGLAPNGPESPNEFLLNAGFETKVYTEAALGYSRVIMDGLTAGAKLKLLIGHSNVSMRNENLKLFTGMDEWRLEGADTWNASLPLEQLLDENQNLDIKFYPKEQIFKNLFAGMGFAVDLGADYKFKDFPLTLSLGINDLGFIQWNGSSNLKYTANYAFDGIYIDSLSLDGINAVFDTIVNGILNGLDFELGAKNPYKRNLTAKINLGAEYGFFDNTLNVGLLYNNVGKRNSLTGAVSYRPLHWFNLAVSYSLLDNFRATNLGVGFGLRLGPIYFNLSTDCISLNNVRVGDLVDFAWVPYRTSAFNFKFGSSLEFGSKIKSDKKKAKKNEE